MKILHALRRPFLNHRPSAEDHRPLSRSITKGSGTRRLRGPCDFEDSRGGVDVGRQAAQFSIIKAHRLWPRRHSYDMTRICATCGFKVAAWMSECAASNASLQRQATELHPSAETLDLSDRALVVSFQTVSSWRSSASNSTGGL